MLATSASSQVLTGRRAAEKLEVAPLGRRIAARFIDCWLIGVTLVAVWGFGFHLATGDCNGVSRCYGFAGLGITLVVVVFGAIATVLYDSVGLAYWGQTIGKAALGLRVTHLGGSRPQWSQCLVRAIAFWLSVPVSGGRHLRYLQRVEYWVEPRDVEVSAVF